MKRFGKNEKQSKVKSVLLQTYLTSLLCMVLCVAMFLGTTYAWFTSEVENSANEIYVGTLKVGLYKLENGVPVNLKSNAGSNAKFFDSDIRWEPGYTALETIQVVNEGDLSFKYNLRFTDGTISEGGDLAAVAKNFEIWVFDHYQKSYVKPISYEAMAADTNWVMVGTLADALEGEPVLKDKNMFTVRASDAGAPTTAVYNAGTTDGVPTTDTYTIALHMKEDASDENLMGKIIGLNVKLVAYQRATEEDAFGDDYDLHPYLNTLVTMNKQAKQSIRFTRGIGGAVDTMVPDTRYQFLPNETYEEAKASPYRYYHADFVVKADENVPAGSMALVGYYDAWCKLNNNNWVAMSNDGVEIEAGQEIRLVQMLGASVNYEEICQYGNDPEDLLADELEGFLCGAKDLTGQNAGTTITVQLRLYETTGDPATDSGSKNEETGKFTVVGEYTYTFPEKPANSTNNSGE